MGVRAKGKKKGGLERDNFFFKLIFLCNEKKGKKSLLKIFSWVVITEMVYWKLIRFGRGSMSLFSSQGVETFHSVPAVRLLALTDGNRVVNSVV